MLKTTLWFTSAGLVCGRSGVQFPVKFVCCLFYILTRSKVISGLVPTCDSAHSWWLYSAAPLGKQANNTMTWYPTHSHYPDTEPTSPCPMLIRPSTGLGSNKYQFYTSMVWLDNGFEPMISCTRDPCSTDSNTVPGPGWVKPMIYNIKCILATS